MSCFTRIEAKPTPAKKPMNSRNESSKTISSDKPNIHSPRFQRRTAFSSTHPCLLGRPDSSVAHPFHRPVAEGGGGDGLFGGAHVGAQYNSDVIEILLKVDFGGHLAEGQPNMILERGSSAVSCNLSHMRRIDIGPCPGRMGRWSPSSNPWGPNPRAQACEGSAPSWRPALPTARSQSNLRRGR